MRVVNDRRGSTRVAVRGEALVHAPQGSLRCRCRDISPSGMSLVSPKAIKPRQRVRIEASFKGQRLVLEAMVVRRNRSREGHVLGVRFEGLAVQAREHLAEVVRNMKVQAALAIQASAFVEQLPALQLPDPQTERAPAYEDPTAMGPLVGAQPQPVPTSGTQAALATSMPSGVAAGGTQEMPAMRTPIPRMTAGGTQEMPAMSSPPPRVTAGGTQEMPAMSMRPPRVAAGRTPQVPATSMRPRVGLEEGWTDEELVTSHYRPSSDRSIEIALEDAPSVDDALVLPDLELDAPSPFLDRTMLTPRPVELAAFAPTSTADADTHWLGPARTGKTMVVHVQDLIAAYAPPEPVEATDPHTTPTTMPRLSEELQAALERLRRRDERVDDGTVPGAAADPTQRPGRAAHRHRRRAVTQVYATTGRDDARAGPLYDAAPASRGKPSRGGGS